MKIAFNPSTVAALTTPPNNKDITFDLRGRNIFARGVKFYGTDTNTWRDIKINNVSIGSNTLDLRNGSNTTLTNTNGIVTINSTWRPVVDNLTSDSTTSSLSAKQGKVLKALIDGKSNSDHNHDGRYVRYYAVTTLDCNNLATGLTAARVNATNAGTALHSAYLYISDVGTPFQIQIPDSGASYIYKRYYSSGKWSGWFKLNAGYADSAGSVAWANVTGKPSSYTPSAHTHAWNSLTHSSTTENQAILTNGKANGWKLQTLNIARWDNAANNAHSHANKSVLDGITSGLVNSWNTAYNFVSNITGTPRKIWGQSFDGTADVDNTLRIRKTTGNYCEGIRIQTGDGNWSTIILGATADSGTNANAWSIHRKSDNNFAISRNSSDGTNGLVMTSTGMGLGTTTPTQRLDVAGNIRTTGNLYISHATNNNMNHDTSNPRIVFSESGSQAVGLVYTDYDNYRPSKGLKVMDTDNVDTSNVWFEVQGYNYSSGYVKNGSNDNYVLLGGGGHKTLSDFASSSHSHNYAANENYGGFTKSGRLPISGFYQSYESESGGNAPWSSWMHLINCQHSNTDNNYALQIAASFYDNNTFKIRVTANSVNNAWRDIIHSGNIGSQTVANAYHLRINSANTWSTWYWAGQSGQPSWLWGSNDGTNMYVWNPNNFNVNTAQYLRSLGNQNCQTGRTQNYGDVYSYNTYSNNTGSPTSYTSVIGFGRGIGGTVEIAGGWCNTHLYWRSLRDCCEDWYSWRIVLDSSNYTEFINNYYWANVKISTSSSTTTSPTVHTLTATRVCAGHDPGIDNSISCSNWFRSSGNTGWYNTTYRGGWYMSDTSWIRAHNGVGIYTGGQIYSDSSIRMGSIRLERTNEINSSDNLLINYGSSTNVSLCQGGGNVGIGTLIPTQKLDVRGNIITKGFGIQPYYLSKSVLPTIRPGDGYTYKCLEIDGTTEISCIIADRAGLVNERGILIKFNKGYDGQIILLKDLQNYGSGNGYFWVMPSGCKIIKADDSSTLIGQNQISNTYDDGYSRFLVYSSVYSVWIEFLCS